MNDIFFTIMFTIVPILVIVIFILVFILMFSPKLRGKFMSRNIKATKYMFDESKDDLTDIGATMGDIAVKTRKKVLDKNEKNLKDMATRQANISKDAIEITARAIKEGFVTDTVYCKYCGKSIDADSKFCKHCGKEQ